MTELEIQWNKSEIGSEIPKKCLFMAFQTKSQDLLDLYSQAKNLSISSFFYTPAPQRGRGYTVLPLSVCPSVLLSIQDIFRRIFLSNCWWQKSDIWSQASYRYTISWVAFLDPSDSYSLFADLVGFYTHWTYMHIFRHIFLSNYWWQKSDVWSQASYRYPILWEAFFDPSASYFLFAEERGYHRWALAHSSSCFKLKNIMSCGDKRNKTFFTKNI
jgi:hypothetical protein